MPVFTFRTPAVQDLAWACFSPALLNIEQIANAGQHVSDCNPQLTPQRRQWLEQLDKYPEPLLEHLARQSSRRLGVYFEHLWHFFFTQDSAFELVAHNLAVRDQGRTLGEFDCIYWCRERQGHFHLELAVKYFLSHRRETTHETASQWHEWLGPNSSDRLDLKLEQLLQRQSVLGDHPLGRKLLAERGVVEPGREITVKGYLFQSFADPLPPPYGFNPQHSLNRWLLIDQLDSFLQQQELDAFQVLPRARWLGPAREDDSSCILSRSGLAKRLQSHFTSELRPRLIAGMDRQGLENCRFFVTAPGWPASS